MLKAISSRRRLATSRPRSLPTTCGDSSTGSRQQTVVTLLDHAAWTRRHANSSPPRVRPPRRHRAGCQYDDDRRRSRTHERHWRSRKEPRQAETISARHGSGHRFGRGSPSSGKRPRGGNGRSELLRDTDYYRRLPNMPAATDAAGRPGLHLLQGKKITERIGSRAALGEYRKRRRRWRTSRGRSAERAVRAELALAATISAAACRGKVAEAIGAEPLSQSAELVARRPQSPRLRGDLALTLGNLGLIGHRAATWRKPDPLPARGKSSALVAKNRMN